MPWLQKDQMTMKLEFIELALSKEFKMSELCRKYGITRPTAYKWLARYREEGVDGLIETSRRPHHSPNRIEANEVELILQTREKFPCWGGRTLRQYLINEGHQNLPCESTFNRTLHKHGKILPEESEKRQPFIRFEREKPNELWQMDFKGHFRTLEGRCHPLTILDDHSRFSLCIKAFAGETFVNVRQALEDVFRSYGLPNEMTMDNGSPWKGNPPFTLSRLTVWMMRLGIKVRHSAPYHPQTQGKEERFHRTFKKEVLSLYQFRGLKDAQVHFDDWREIYNYHRPHQGIGLQRPADRYLPSERKFIEVLPPLEYGLEDIVRKVQASGTVSYKDKPYFVGEHLRGEYVALRRSCKEGVFDVYYGEVKISRVNIRRN